MAATDNDTIIWKDKKHHLWFPLSFTTYSVENDRLLIRTGLFSTQLDETLLYRIVDITCKQTLLGKLFGTGDVIIKSRVDSSPEIVLHNIVAPFKVHNIISDAVEDSRQKRNVVGKEFYGAGGHGHIDEDGDGVCDFEEMDDN